MKIQYCSDLHLEFPENNEFLMKKPVKPEGDILILAGDIVPFALLDEHSDFFDYVSDNFKITYWIPGNHEYYHSDAVHRSGTFTEQIRTNVFLLNNHVINLNGIRLIFSTLWSKINPANQWVIRQKISDFHVIKFDGKPFTPVHFNRQNQECTNFLTGALKEHYSGKTLIVTHHVPTFYNYPEKYRGDVLNEAFAVELYDLIERSYIDYWIFGHHHYNCPAFEIGTTKLITNQLGYVKYDEHHLFQPDAVIDFSEK